MTLLIRLFVNTLAVLTAAYILKGVQVNGLMSALVVAIVLGMVNAFVRPILIFLTLPITVLTLGLFLLVINAGMIILVSRIVPGFQVENFWWAMLYSLVVSAVNSFLSALI